MHCWRRIWTLAARAIRRGLLDVAGKLAAGGMEERNVAGHDRRLWLQPCELWLRGAERRLAGPDDTTTDGLGVWVRAQRQYRPDGARSTPQNTREFIVAIGFGEGHHAALTTAMGALATPFDQHLKRFIEQWHRAASPREGPRMPRTAAGCCRSATTSCWRMRTKTYAGAFIASASIPWGIKGDDDLGGYHLVWTRDMVQSATALLACGRVDTARRALVYLACTQKPDGGFAQNFWIDGTPYWTGIQLDEVAFPIILAWRLWKLDGLGDWTSFPLSSARRDFWCGYAPVTQQERWEEAAGYSPSTLAAVISGLDLRRRDCAARMGLAELATFLEEHADWIEAHLEDWTVTNDGVLLPGVKRHYMRIRPPECGEPYAHEGCGEEMIRYQQSGSGGEGWISRRGR